MKWGRYGKKGEVVLSEIGNFRARNFCLMSLCLDDTGKLLKVLQFFFHPP